MASDDELDPNVEHSTMTNDEWLLQATKVSDFARDLGLHGVMILSPRCPGCGMLHDWHMLTDTPHEQKDHALADLLAHYADVVRHTQPDTFEPRRQH